MLKVLLATGFEKLDNTLLKRFANDEKIELLDKPVYYREALTDTIERLGADIVIISDYLDGGSLSQDQLIKLVRKKHPDVRIVYIIKDEENIDLQKFLFTLGVYDVISILPKLESKKLYHLITNGNQWKDVSHFFSDFDPSEKFQLNEEFLFSSSKKPEYQAFNPRVKKKSTDIQNNFSAFWSPRSQSGATTLLSNASIMLAQRPEERILLVDFNVLNPNLHLVLDIEDYDGDHNLSALCEDISEGLVQRPSVLSEYLIFHNVHKNISVLPGLILKYDTPSEETLLKAIELIFAYAEKESYTTVSFDMDNNLLMSYNIDILKRVTQIVMPITERPGTIVNLQKIFDTEYGPFYLNFLDINKLHPVLNMTTNTVETKKIAQIIENLLNLKVNVEIPYIREIAISTNEGVPFLRTKPDVNTFREFVKISNVVHDVFIVPPSADFKKSSIGLFGKRK